MKFTVDFMLSNPSPNVNNNPQKNPAGEAGFWGDEGW
jgi:hypothetical protein